MKIFYNKFLIISSVALLIGGVYLYSSNDMQSTEIIPVAFGSSLASSNSSSSSVEASDLSTSDKISSDVAFLTTLVALKNIKIDTSLFENKSFSRLEDNSVKIGQVTAGRTNPFAPIGSYSSSTVVSGGSVVAPSKVVTDQPTQITDKSVVLNGTINVTSGVTDAYFEYGNTVALGSVTPIVKQSLVGTFIKSVTGLSPGTNYFYKACAKINNVALCGDVVSFITN